MGATMMDEHAKFDEAFSAALERLGVPVAAAARELMWRHFERIVEVNRQFNLTRITSPVEAAIKHYADSLALLAAGWWTRAKRVDVLDVGTGAGFPAVPLAIACPQWRVMAIDGTGKKSRFVAECAARLGIANLQAEHARAGGLARAGDKRFGLVLLRAVTQLAPGLEEVYSLVAPGGSVVFYKSATLSAEEVEGGVAAARRRGFTPAGSFEVELMGGEEPLARRLVRFVNDRKGGSAPA